MKISKVTPVLVVDAIEAVLDFRERKLGLERVASVPRGFAERADEVAAHD